MCISNKGKSTPIIPQKENMFESYSDKGSGWISAFSLPSTPHRHSLRSDKLHQIETAGFTSHNDSTSKCVIFCPLFLQDTVFSSWSRRAFNLCGVDASFFVWVKLLRFPSWRCFVFNERQQLLHLSSSLLHCGRRLISLPLHHLLHPASTVIRMKQRSAV